MRILLLKYQFRTKSFMRNCDTPFCKTLSQNGKSVKCPLIWHLSARWKYSAGNSCRTLPQSSHCALRRASQIFSNKLLNTSLGCWTRFHTSSCCSTWTICMATRSSTSSTRQQSSSQQILLPGGSVTGSEEDSSTPSRSSSSAHHALASRP